MPPRSPRPAVQLVIDNVRLTRGLRTVVEGLSAHVEAGEALVLTGANGAGKTTVIRAVAGFLAPAAGSIRLEGGDPELTLAEHCHYVGHLNGVKPSLTVAENLDFWAAYLGGDATAAKVPEALRRLGLDTLGAIPAGYLSAGQKRRLALARLLVVHRPLWLLDEPTAALDAAAEALFLKAVNEHLAADGLVVAATHHPLGLKGSKELRLDAGAEAAA